MRSRRFAQAVGLEERAGTVICAEEERLAVGGLETVRTGVEWCQLDSFWGVGQSCLSAYHVMTRNQGEEK